MPYPGSHLVQPPCSGKETYGNMPLTLSKKLLHISKEKTPQPHWATCASAQSPVQHRNASQCSDRTSRVPVNAHCLLSWHWAPMKRAWLRSLCTLPSVFRHIDKISPEPPLLQAGQSQLSLRLSSQQRCYTLVALHLTPVFAGPCTGEHRP